jgi:hypothetical protein
VRVDIAFDALYARSDRREWLVETHVREGGLAQHFALQIAERPSGQVLVRPAPVGHPRATWGVKESVRLLAALLAEAHPGLALHASGVGSMGSPSGEPGAEA